MAYFAPTVTAAGLSLPSYSDIQSNFLDQFQTIYGATTYLGNDESDYQWISAISLKIFDNMSLCQLSYNNRSPLTAIGAGLDGIVKINGISRLSPSSSTVVLSLGGTPGKVVTNAVISDINGILWSLPSSVTIGSGGTVSASAVCQQTGSVSAEPNTITTPVGGFTSGWTSVTNPGPAVTGTRAESDSNLRARQSISTALPSSTRLAGTQAEIEAIVGVSRVLCLENQSNVIDSYGNGAHSVTCVVEGGTDIEVATAIYNNRGIGPNTQAATATSMIIIDVTDPTTGVVTPIGFIRPSYVPIYVILNIHGLTSAFNSTVQSEIIAALVSYLNSLKIGEEVTQSSLYGIALSVMTDLKQPIFSIRAILLGTSPSPSGTSDLVLSFFQVSEGLTSNITINSV